MDRYLDIRLLPDPEFPAHHLMNALFSKLHRCFVKTGMVHIGVSFPEVDERLPRLGNVLRLHGPDAAFESLMAHPWLTGMRDHIQLSELSTPPATASHRLVRRVQAKSNPERLRRRQMKRHGWTAEEARERIPDSIQESLSLPFLNLESGSTQHRFRLFIEHKSVNAPQDGTFNAYGLSSSATVPWF